MDIFGGQRHERERAVADLQSAQAQFDAGGVTKLDLDRAVVNVSNTRSEIPNLNQNMNKAENRLTLLLEQNPGAAH